jgi:hypothetical protein
MAVIFLEIDNCYILASSVGDSRVRLREVLVGVFWFALELMLRKVH